MKVELSVAVKPINNNITAVCFNSFDGYADTEYSLVAFFKKLILYKPSLRIMHEIEACFRVRVGVAYVRGFGRRFVKC